jgi:hypothetical protein
MKKVILFSLALVSIISACEKKEDKILISDLVSKNQYYEDEIFNESNQKIYGKWKFIYSDGGQGGTRTNATIDSYLEVVRYGIYGKVVKNDVKEYGQLLVTKQDITQTLISFLPSDGYRTDYFLTSASVSFKDNDTLILWDRAYDGYFYHYKRIK